MNLGVRSKCLHFAVLAKLLIFCCGCFSIGMPAYGDLRIVVDTSKRMMLADPDNLRGAAIELLARSMPVDSRGGLWAYSQLTQQLVSHGPTTDMWRQLMTVHGRNLAPGGAKVDPTTALKAATWDMDAVDRPYVDVVWISNGQIDLGATELEHSNTRQLLLNTWAAKLRQARIRVHPIAIAKAGTDVPIELDFLRQVANLSGGLHKVVGSLDDMQAVMMDILRLMQIQPTAQADRSGRFQVTPGVQRLSLLWLHSPNAEAPQLETPAGLMLDRNTAVPDGRWLLAQDFEMVTVNAPQVGWWRIHGVPPDQLGVFGDLEIRVDGLGAPVIPTEESHAVIQVFERGQLITHAGFLDLLDVRAWLVDEKGKSPLPVERDGEQYRAYFVSLRDGSYDLEVQVRAPTFTRHTSVPFVVSNPIRVDVQQNLSGVSAWLNFTHADVDYRTVKVAAKVRKPPAVGGIIPAKKLPAGLYQIPITETEGVVELTFNVSGNYLNGEGFFLKTRRQTVTLPLLSVQSMRFDAQGKRIDEPAAQADAAESVLTGPAQPSMTPVAGDVPRVVMNPALLPKTEQPANQPVLPPVAPEPALPEIPLWFVGIICLLNLCIAGFLWWILRLPPIPFELRIAPEAAPAA